VPLSYSGKLGLIPGAGFWIIGFWIGKLLHTARFGLAPQESDIRAGFEHFEEVLVRQNPQGADAVAYIG
jgi:hypothetical protein